MPPFSDPAVFDRFFAETVAPQRQKLIALARFSRIVRFVFFSVFAVVLAGILYYWWQLAQISEATDPNEWDRLFDKAFSFFWVLFGTVLGGIILVVVLSLFGTSSRFKELVLPDLIRHYGQLRYSSGSKSVEGGPFASSANSLEGGLLKTELLPRYTFWTLSDQIEGLYRDQPVFMIEVNAIKRETTTGADGKSKSSSTTVFRGMMGCVLAPAAQEIEGRYVLTGRNAHHGFERIKLESREFEEAFDFAGTDQIEGRTLMTPVRMERWTALARAIDPMRINLMFTPERIFFAIDIKGDFLDRGITKGAAHKLENTMRDMIADIDNVFSVIDFLLFDEMPEEEQL